MPTGFLPSFWGTANPPLSSRQKNTQIAALKVRDRSLVDEHGKAEQLERLEREKSLIGQKHPNLIEILDVGYSDVLDLMYVVMQYLPWENMYQQSQQIPHASIRLLISQVAAAAKFLEDLGIAHRDIKVDNILVSPDFQQVCLLDLGVIRPIAKSEVTDDDYFVGTHQYAPPEFILRTEDPSLRGYRAITFYQLGGVLHDLIMRRRLFADFQRPPTKLTNAIQQENPDIHASDVELSLIALAFKRVCEGRPYRRRQGREVGYRPGIEIQLSREPVRKPASLTGSDCDFRFPAGAREK